MELLQESARRRASSGLDIAQKSLADAKRVGHATLALADGAAEGCDAIGGGGRTAFPRHNRLRRAPIIDGSTCARTGQHKKHIHANLRHRCKIGGIRRAAAEFIVDLAMFLDPAHSGELDLRQSEPFPLGAQAQCHRIDGAIAGLDRDDTIVT